MIEFMTYFLIGILVIVLIYAFCFNTNPYIEIEKDKLQKEKNKIEYGKWANKQDIKKLKNK